ncbi:histidinol dehydrogenase [Gallaecimonas sp. GXIMD4217]|uniref:histidinol dehydrogenase n=1 Tax=Gallaecimonas sp. GXIMD4217 TaxID=3131927 RepID=UPI00311B1906
MLSLYDCNELTAGQLDALLKRPEQSQSAELRAGVAAIIDQIRKQGDQALDGYARELDGYEGPRLVATKGALERISLALRQALEQASANIRRFHERQRPQALVVETAPGVICEQRWQPLSRIGLYVPGGSAPLPSSVLMQAIPARLAGVEEIILATPGPVDDAVLAAAALAGIAQVLALGGAQAIAAMALGTQSLAPVVKLFGPGNAWVTEAKRQLGQQGVAIDMPAGPSELMVIADGTANAAFVAADLLSQAEHGPDSQVLLVTDSRDLAESVNTRLAKQLEALPRRAICEQSLAQSRALLVRDLDQGVRVANAYGPEHLILQTNQNERLLPGLRNAGAIFVGPFSPESAGDYASGSNHVLPTYGLARSYSGLGLLDFMRRYTVQTLSREGLKGLAPTLLALASAEGLDGHAQAVKVRLEAGQ